MSQLGLFDPPAKPAPVAKAEAAKQARHYQIEAIDSVKRELETNRSTLLVMATGTGKTFCFSKLGADWNGRVLVLAHRYELVEQAAKALEHICGERIGIEQADRYSHGERIVVASVQTVYQDPRLERLIQGGGFSLIIPDEAHHYIAPSYRRVLSAFPGAKVCGVTATPDRGDELAMGQVFETVAFQYGIEQAIPDGYLVPIQGRHIGVNEIDLSEVSSQAGDLNVGQLDTVMVRAAEGIVAATLSEFRDQCGVVFMPGKKSALYAAERFNALKPGSAVVVVDDTPKDERASIMRSVQAGNVQWFVNCMVASEGFDWRDAQVMVGARPTKSRALYTQQVGRVTRPKAGVVDHIYGADKADERRAAIKASSKPFAIIANFCGNDGKHSLASVEDVLGGNYDEPVVERAKELAKKEKGGDPESLLERAQAEIDRQRKNREMREQAKRLKGRVEYEVEQYDPFKLLGFQSSLTSERSIQKRYGIETATVPQLRLLANLGYDTQAIAKSGEISKSTASKLISKAIERERSGLASPSQLAKLKQYGIGPECTDKGAKAALRYLTNLDYGKRGSIDAETVRRLAKG